ncbi:MAG TPA: hypothetical protein VLK23_20550 [Thermodesulfobacteriota bacterium]|nr:hypothetical protein [Thermodesulfobacteriota bacterium]
MPEKMKKILIILTLVFIFSVALTSVGIAYKGGVKGIGLLGLSFFLTFGVILVLGQLIPAGVLISVMIGTSFSSFRKTEVPIQTA